MDPEIIVFISQVGFPIGITVYLLLTRDKVITTNTEALNELKTEIQLIRESKK